MTEICVEAKWLTPFGRAHDDDLLQVISLVHIIHCLVPFEKVSSRIRRKSRMFPNASERADFPIWYGNPLTGHVVRIEYLPSFTLDESV